MSGKREKSTHRIILIVMIILIVVILLLIDALIQMWGNKKTANQTSRMLMNQIISIMDQNEQEEDALLQTLKEDYIVRAQAVAYMLSNNGEAEYDLKELLKIADLMSVDEIHLFDENGTMFCGTIPKYYGIKLDSGEQISYFKPMLNDKQLSMCQDLTPNTAEGKSMMYAMVWDESGSFMVQVGIEPKRLFQEFNNNNIAEVIKSMPMYEGVEIYVADKESGIIVASTDLNTVDILLKDAAIEKKTYCVSQEHGDYLVVISQSIVSANRGIIITLTIVLVYICIAMAIAIPFVVRMNKKIQKEKEEKFKTQELAVNNMKHHLSIIEAVSKELTDIILIDTVTGKAAMLKIGGKMQDYRSIMEGNWKLYEETWKNFIDNFVVSDDAAGLFDAVQIEKVEKELETSDEYLRNFRLNFHGKIYNYQTKFVHIDSDDGNHAMIVASFRNIDDILEGERKRQQLEKEANTDGLTGIYNRNAFENDMKADKNTLESDNFAVVALDVNGLKNTNDTYGHDAGDELLRGAADCIQKCFGIYGKVYRTGGDEFFALICAGEAEIEMIQKNFEKVTNDWSGEKVRKLSVSYGIASKKEFPDLAPAELLKIADSRMYKYKQDFYSGNGIEHII